jgi:hypothetical protein
MCFTNLLSNPLKEMTPDGLFWDTVHHGSLLHVAKEQPGEPCSS